MRQLCIVGLMLAGWSWGVGAAIPYKQAGPNKKNVYIDHGVFTGGALKETASFLGIRRFLAKETGIDRWILDLGDIHGEPLKDRPAYFHIAVDRDQKRIVIDLQNVARSKLDREQLASIMARSPYVRDVQLRVDGAKRVTHLTINMKQAVEVEAFELPVRERGGRIALDVRPPRASRK
jgi:hypothetical protein